MDENKIINWLLVIVIILYLIAAAYLGANPEYLGTGERWFAR